MGYNDINSTCDDGKVLLYLKKYTVKSIYRVLFKITRVSLVVNGFDCI